VKASPCAAQAGVTRAVRSFRISDDAGPISTTPRTRASGAALRTGSRQRARRSCRRRPRSGSRRLEAARRRGRVRERASAAIDAKSRRRRSPPATVRGEAAEGGNQKLRVVEGTASLKITLFESSLRDQQRSAVHARNKRIAGMKQKQMS